jgi:hypothetical protein
MCLLCRLPVTLRAALSRRRGVLAGITAVFVTRDTGGLRQALKKLEVGSTMVTVTGGC